MGAKTLLIDTDLRRPVLHAIFSLPQTEGLTNYLIGNTHLEDAIKKSRIDNLSILTSGTLPPNPSELLASMKMDGFIDQVSSQYDMVLFDSPPIIPVTDAAVLAPKLDGTVLVVKSGETERDALLRSRVLFDNVNANVFGVLINGVNISHMQGSYYYYYYEYGDNKEGGKRKKHRAFSE
jgi:capsular exopolysaccharide synthesis family protein